MAFQVIRLQQWHSTETVHYDLPLLLYLVLNAEVVVLVAHNLLLFLVGVQVWVDSWVLDHDLTRVDHILAFEIGEIGLTFWQVNVASDKNHLFWLSYLRYFGFDVGWVVVILLWFLLVFPLLSFLLFPLLFLLLFPLLFSSAKYYLFSLLLAFYHLS